MLSWLDSGALINVDAKGCGMSVVQGQIGHKQEGFYPGVQLYLTSSSCRVQVSQLRLKQRGQKNNPHCTEEGP